MTERVSWYRSRQPAPSVRRTLRRIVRDAARGILPEPQVRGRVMVIPSRRTVPKLSRDGWRSQFHGLFSEFHSVLGALVYARRRGAAGVRVDFTSPLYGDPTRGSNWWPHFFERETMRIDGDAGPAPEVRLDGVLTKYGRFGGFSDIVQGDTPYLYPMTFGLDRSTLHELVADHATPRCDIRDEAGRLARTLFQPGAFVVGVHYRGTDAIHGFSGALRHYRVAAVPYAAYLDEVQRVLADRAPSVFQVFVASDEAAFVDAAHHAFPGRAVQIEAPRAGTDRRPVHLTASEASPYDKGRSALLDALLLASTNYLVKGRSNLSDASLIFNPTLPYSFCPDVAI